MDKFLDSRCRPNRYLSLVVWLMPSCRFKLWALRKLGNFIGTNVSLGINLVIGCGAFSIDDNAIIQIGNVFRNVAHVRMGKSSFMGKWNQITAAPEYQRYSDAVGMLLIAEMAGLTNRHYLDCSGQLILRPNSGIGGIKSVFQTHELDLANNETTIGQIVLEKNAMTGTGCIVLKGAHVPERSVLAAGSVLPKARDDAAMPTSGLYGGAPARYIREIKNMAWWDRDVFATPVTPFDDTAFRAEVKALHS
jgi:acetyltransferase-like isoleucine patch superfamily enzyme